MGIKLEALRTGAWTPQQERWIRPIGRGIALAHRWLLAGTGGLVGQRFTHGAPVCLLTTRGRRSGRLRTTPVIYLREGQDLIVAASHLGLSAPPAWCHNLKAEPTCSITIGRTAQVFRASPVDEAERNVLWKRLVEIYPDFDIYRRRAPREIDVFRLVAVAAAGTSSSGA